MCIYKSECMSLLHLYPYNHAHWVASHEIGSIRPLSFYKNGSFKCFSSLPIPNLYLYLSITRTHPKLTKTPLILNLGGPGVRLLWDGKGARPWGPWGQGGPRMAAQLSWPLRKLVPSTPSADQGGGPQELATVPSTAEGRDQ